MANWANTARLGDPRDPAWQRENLVTISPVDGQNWQVYKPAAQAFEGLLKDLIAAGYAPHSSGGFNYRTVRGGTRLSQHAFGNAIDINAPQNPMLARGQPMVTNLPANVGEMAKKYGLEWGGNWSRPDPMHFEWSGGPGGPLNGSAPPAFVPPDGPKGQEVYAPPAPQAPAAAPERPPQSPLGAMMAGFASGFGGSGGGPQAADAGQPRVLQDGGFGATMAAQQGADQAKQLAFGLSPDIEKMLALAPKPFARKGAALVG